LFLLGQQRVAPVLIDEMLLQESTVAIDQSPWKHSSLLLSVNCGYERCDTVGSQYAAPTGNECLVAAAKMRTSASVTTPAIPK
jgi:hypothetical protein